MKVLIGLKPKITKIFRGTVYDFDSGSICCMVIEIDSGGFVFYPNDLPEESKKILKDRIEKLKAYL